MWVQIVIGVGGAFLVIGMLYSIIEFILNTKRNERKIEDLSRELQELGNKVFRMELDKSTDRTEILDQVHTILLERDLKAEKAKK